MFDYVVGPLVTLSLCYVGPLFVLAMLCRPFGDLSGVWLSYVGPL